MGYVLIKSLKSTNSSLHIRDYHYIGQQVGIMHFFDKSCLSYLSAYSTILSYLSKLKDLFFPVLVYIDINIQLMAYYLCVYLSLSSWDHTNTSEYVLRKSSNHTRISRANDMTTQVVLF